MKQSITLAAFLVTVSACVAFAALGEDPETCNDRYGKEFHRHDDVYNAQNEMRLYRKPAYGAQVLFNRKLVAIEVSYLSKKFSDEQVLELLGLNGKDWQLQKPKFGSAMDRSPGTIWLTPDGKKAVLEPSQSGSAAFRFSSPERLQEIADHTPARR